MGQRLRSGWSGRSIDGDIAGPALELEQARREIARQSRLLAELAAETRQARAEAEALSQFRSHALATIGHDLRTPLNAVIGFSEAMQHELHGPLGNDRYRDYAVHIRESGEQLLRAAEAMLMRSHMAASHADGFTGSAAAQPVAIRDTPAIASTRAHAD